MTAWNATRGVAALVFTLSIAPGCTLFGSETHDVRAATVMDDGRVVVVVQTQGPQDEAGRSEFRGLSRFTLTPSGETFCDPILGPEDRPAGYGSAHVVTESELLVTESVDGVAWISADGSSSGVIDEAAPSFGRFLQGAWTGSDGAGRVATTNGIFSVAGDGRVTSAAVLDGFDGDAIEALYGFVPTSDDLRGVAVRCVGGVTPVESLVEVDCSSGECVLDGPGVPADGRCSEGVLVRDAETTAFFVEAVDSEPGVGPTAISVTTLEGGTRRIADLNTFSLATAPREAGGIVIASLTYADTLEVVLVDADGTTRDASMGTHDGWSFLDGFGVVATGTGVDEEIRAFVGHEDGLRMIVLDVETGELRRRDLAVCH